MCSLKSFVHRGCRIFLGACRFELRTAVLALLKAQNYKSSKYIFAQLTDYLPQRVFDRMVDK